ncbi:MAG: hypothetical protein ABH828_06340 [archaeon]
MVKKTEDQDELLKRDLSKIIKRAPEKKKGLGDSNTFWLFVFLVIAFVSYTGVNGVSLPDYLVKSTAEPIEEVVVPEIIMEEEAQEAPIYEINGNQVKVLYTMCSDIKINAENDIHEDQLFFNLCKDVCNELSLGRFNGNRYCTTDDYLICTCV